MKKGLVSGLVLLALGLICGLVLAGVNAITAPVIAENEYRAKLAILGEFYDVDDYDIELLELSGAIDSVFLLKNKTTNVLEKAVYSVRSYGYQSDIVMLIAINADMTVDKYKVVSQGETAGIGDVIVGYDFQMQGENIANLDAFAGPSATFSANAVRACFQLVGARAAIDFAGVTPQIVLTINSLVYNLDPATFLTKPFVASITYGETNIQTQVYLALNFAFIEMVNPLDPTPEQTFLTELQLKAQQVSTVSNRTYFSVYDAGTHTLSITTRGYNSANPIVLAVVLNAAEDAVVSITPTSAESYIDSFDYAGTYGPAPGIENHLIARFQANQSLDGVAGATVTSSAMIRALQLLQSYLEGGE